MNNLNRKKLLIRFLKEYNSYNEYINNIQMYIKENKCKFDSFDEMIKSYSVSKYNSEIFYSFCWANTKQGGQFWADINKKWMKLIKYEINK